jgi:Pectate lyase
MKIRVFCAATLAVLGVLFAGQAWALAFPGAEGYGANATGGTTVVHVTNLNDAGPGSLRDALSEGGRKIVFDVAGTITIATQLAVPSNTTLDGSTAPSPGITISGHSTSVSGKNNIIIRHLRFRETMSGPKGKCSLQGADGCHDIIVDHCSIEQGRWDCMAFTDKSHDITIQYCIIGEAIDPQKFGLLVNAVDRISIHHNLFVDNQSRNPKLKGNSQYINNVVYNWGTGGGLVGGHSSAEWNSDVINNFFIAGPSSKAGWLTQCTATDVFHVSGNHYDLDKDGALNPRAIPDSAFKEQGVTLRPDVIHKPTAAVTVDSAAKAMELAAGGSFGCQPLDDIDKRLCGYVQSYGKLGQIGLPTP